MKAKLILLVMSFLFITACNDRKNEVKVSREVKKNKKKTSSDDVSVMFLEKQLLNLQYQIGAFKIAKERLVNSEIKNYLEQNLPKLQEISKEFEEMASKKNIKIMDNKTFEKELYKLSIADAKEFDNIFVLYYKNFLKATIKNQTELKLNDEDLILLKNKYGNILYEQKLYFDLIK